MNEVLYPELHSLMANTPNYKGRFLQGIDTNTKVGDKIEAGLPNITGNFVSTDHYVYPNSSRGAFSDSSASDLGTRDHQLHGGNPVRFYFNAARSSAVYGRSATVQPPSVIVKYIIKAE